MTRDFFVGETLRGFHGSPKAMETPFLLPFTGKLDKGEGIIT